jgi:hypothetical protein
MELIILVNVAFRTELGGCLQHHHGRRPSGDGI